jgi:hypothetical protein
MGFETELAMRVLTDYTQWYDGIFDAEPPVFHRQAFTSGGLSKRRQFALFESLGWRTPMHGLVRDLARRLGAPLAGQAPPREAWDQVRLVVYLDELAHRGEGKALLPLAEACERYPHCYASVFHAAAVPATVYRLVRFGRWGGWILQSGPVEAWRSNRDDTERVLVLQRTDAANPIPRVLWAVDFIAGPEGLLALDFNTAPDLEVLGETGALTVRDVADELRWAASAAPEHLRQF